MIALLLLGARLALVGPPAPGEAAPAAPTAPGPAATAGGSPVAPTTDDPVLDDYFAKMRTAGLLDNREATLEEIQQVLQEAQDRYVRGNALGSAILLFELTHNPRYANFSELPEMNSAWYHLGVALQDYGADQTAEAAYARVLARGPDDSYFMPALRRQVDIALDSKDYVRGLADLDRSLHPEGKPPIELTGVDLDEREYLEARALQQQGDVDGALAKYADVGDHSRFYTAALYLEGVIYAERRDFRKAEGAFCKVVGGPNEKTAAYYVDRRYFPVRDLAQLGLGRVAHEELRHGHAFYHYFSVPQDSPELPQALFEASWTMAEEGEYAVARGLIAELQERFPDAPQATEARVLAALLELYDCDFRKAEKDFTAFIDEMAPVADHIEEIRADPDKTRALHRELTKLRHGGGTSRGDTKPHELLLKMMDEDPRYARMTHRADVLRQEAGFAAALSTELGRLQAKLEGSPPKVARSPEGDALDAVADAEALEEGAAGLERQIREAEAAGADPASLQAERAEVDAIRAGVRDLKGDAKRMLAAGPPPGEAPTSDLTQALARDQKRMARLRTESLAVSADLDAQAAKLAAARLGQLHHRIDDLMGEARMGRIDAVLGAKKKLEIEVRDMAAGRFPPELFGKLEIEGMVGDDEEFWPYEGEYWADEYEGYR